jgi:hypothetical protein
VPQEPPQPSEPQLFAEQSGEQLFTHLPEELQVFPLGQLPQEPPQPSEPQLLLRQSGAQG